MTINELIECAKSAPVTAEQVEELRKLLEKEERDQTRNPFIITKKFLDRTYGM